jgi:hypothetical protein
LDRFIRLKINAVHEKFEEGEPTVPNKRLAIVHLFDLLDKGWGVGLFLDQKEPFATLGVDGTAMDIDEALVLLNLDSKDGAVSHKEVNKVCRDHDRMKVCKITHKRNLANVQDIVDSEPVNEHAKHSLSVKHQHTNVVRRVQ